MTWQVSTVVDKRRELVQAVTVGGERMSDVCRRLEVSRQTGYKFLARAREEGDAGLEDRSRRPKSSPRRTPAEMEERVCELRRLRPAWGGRKLHHRLKAMGVLDVPSPSAITDILARNGLLDPGRRTRRDWQRFEAEAPNQMWQMDFKGDFALSSSGRCYTLTVLDDHSRFNLCLQACANQRRETVQSQLLTVFASYGLPEMILVDNGSPWGSGYSRQPHTAFTAWLIRLGIYVSHGRPYHPQTRGKDERFHRSLDEEVLLGRQWLDLVMVQLALDPWRSIYNLERPHEALGYAVPASRYVSSTRELPSLLPPLEYQSTDEVRKVQASGEIYFRGRELKVGRAFRGEAVALRPTEAEGVLDVYYAQQRIGRVDLRSPLLNEPDV